MSIAGDIRRGNGIFAWTLLGASTLRLVLERGYFTPAYLGWMATLFVFLRGQQAILETPSPRRIRLSLLVNFLALDLGYVLIGFAMRSHVGWRADAALYRLDCWLCRGDPQRFFGPLHHPLASTAALIGYASFVAYLVYLFLAECFTLTALTGRLQLILMTLYGIGFSGYLLVPAAGPIFFHPAPLPAAATNGFVSYLDRWVIRCCSRVDVWPSLHAAVTLLTLIWTFRFHRRSFAAFLPLSVALVFGALYFQYHYLTDILCGFGLGLAVLPAFPPRSRPG